MKKAKGNEYFVQQAEICRGIMFNGSAEPPERDSFAVCSSHDLVNIALFMLWCLGWQHKTMFKEVLSLVMTSLLVTFAMH